MTSSRLQSCIALTHTPSPALEAGQRTFIDRTVLDYETTLRQHADYCQLLEKLGISVHKLTANAALPDSTFIEDTAVVLDEAAVLTSMGTAARRAELSAVEKELQPFRQIERIALPATLEGGDVLRVGRTLLVGLSARTNSEGILALEKIVRPYGYQVIAVRAHGCLHLKTACTALPDGSLLVNPDWLDLEPLRFYDLIRVPLTEPWAANTLSIGKTVCMPACQEQTADLVRSRGFTVATTDLSEFAKAEGGITCLSILLCP
jgi:dimethylargininase